MEKIIHDKLDILDKDLAIQIVNQASNELTQEKVPSDCCFVISVYFFVF